MPTFTKKARPSFSAPKPPIPPETSDLVENDKPAKPNIREAKFDEVETEVIKPEADTQPATSDVASENLSKSATEAPKDPQKAPTPPAKLVSRTKDESIESPLEATLKDVSQASQDTPPEETAQKTESAKETSTKVPAVKGDDMEPESKKPFPPQKSRSSAGNGFFGTVIVIFALILSVSGWIMYFKEKGDVNLNFNLDFFSSSKPVPTPTPMAEEPEPEPTPDPRVDIYLDVLNGSGVAGAAGRTADKLRAIGYQIAQIGNADSQKYTETEIYTASDFDNETLLISDLLDAFDTATISGLLDEGESTASARIIVGQDWEK